MSGLVVVTGCVGLLIGSFLNVVIARVPRGGSIIRPASHCPICRTPLRARDNVPLASWLILGRKCRACRAPISAIYPAVEAGTGLLFVLVAWRIGADAALPAHLVATAAFVALSVIDLQTLRLPDRVVLPASAVTALALLGAAVIDDRLADFGTAAAGSALGFGVLLAIHVARPNAMGFGDAKLAALCGSLLGWHGLVDVAVGLYAAAVLGAFTGIAMMARGGAGLRTAIPFGPFLAAGTLVGVLWLGGVADWLRALV
jgi:leader peptidase (prepilin peptidase)/N-methyltransferase